MLVETPSEVFPLQANAGDQCTETVVGLIALDKVPCNTTQCAKSNIVREMCSRYLRRMYAIKYNEQIRIPVDNLINTWLLCFVPTLPKIQHGCKTA